MQLARGGGGRGGEGTGGRGRGEVGLAVGGVGELGGRGGGGGGGEGGMVEGGGQGGRGSVSSCTGTGRKGEPAEGVGGRGRFGCRGGRAGLPWGVWEGMGGATGGNRAMVGVGGSVFTRSPEPLGEGGGGAPWRGRGGGTGAWAEFFWFRPGGWAGVGGILGVGERQEGTLRLSRERNVGEGEALLCCSLHTQRVCETMEETPSTD